MTYVKAYVFVLKGEEGFLILTGDPTLLSACCHIQMVSTGPCLVFKGVNSIS